MTQEEVVDLLTLVQIFDKRTVGEADVMAWTDVAHRGRWTFTEASEAVKHYYASTISERPWVMPSHITNWIKADRQDKAMRRQTDDLVKPVNPARAKAIADAIDHVAKSTVIPDEPRPLRNPALGVKCPFCGAQPLRGCTRPSIGGRRIPVRQPHPSRVDLASVDQ